MKKIIAKNTISQLIGKVISAGTTFLVTVVVARRFGAAGYGDFTKITTYVAFFFLIADFGLNAIYLQKSHEESMWEILLGLRIAGAVLLIFLSLLVLALIPIGVGHGYTDAVRIGIMIYSSAILFQGLITTANAIFQKHLRYDFATIALAVGSLVTVLVLFLPLGPFLGITALLAGSIGTAATGLFLTRPFITTHRLVFHPARLMKLLGPTLPLGLTLLFNLVYFHADSVILTLTRSTAEVGIYGLAYKVFEVPLVLPTFFMNAVYPVLVGRMDKLKHIIGQSLLAMLAGSVVATIFLWVVAPFLTLVKSDFGASVGALRILSLGLPFFFLSSVTMWALIALKKQWILAVMYAASMVLNIGLNIWLIPVYGFIAASWITVGSEAVVLLASGILLLNFV